MIICGGGSDFLDGWIARKWQVTSWHGRILDAFADKLFVLSVLITFVVSGKIDLWLVPAIIARDLMVVFIACYTQYCRAWDSFRQTKTRWSGKIATAGQFLLFVSVTLMPEFVDFFIAGAIILSVAAALDYSFTFIQAVRKRSANVTNKKETFTC